MPSYISGWIKMYAQADKLYYHNWKIIFISILIVNLFILIGLTIKVGQSAFWPMFLLELIFIFSALWFHRAENKIKNFLKKF